MTQKIHVPCSSRVEPLCKRAASSTLVLGQIFSGTESSNAKDTPPQACPTGQAHQKTGKQQMRGRRLRRSRWAGLTMALHPRKKPPSSTLVSVCPRLALARRDGPAKVSISGSVSVSLTRSESFACEIASTTLASVDCPSDWLPQPACGKGTRARGTYPFKALRHHSRGVGLSSRTTDLSQPLDYVSAGPGQHTQALGRRQPHR
eukprot:1211891-Rhodomonas_salina.2